MIFNECGIMSIPFEEKASYNSIYAKNGIIIIACPPGLTLLFEKLPKEVG